MRRQVIAAFFAFVVIQETQCNILHVRLGNLDEDYSYEPRIILETIPDPQHTLLFSSRLSELDSRIRHRLRINGSSYDGPWDPDRFERERNEHTRVRRAYVVRCCGMRSCHSTLSSKRSRNRFPSQTTRPPAVAIASPSGNGLAISCPHCPVGWETNINTGPGSGRIPILCRKGCKKGWLSMLHDAMQDNADDEEDTTEESTGDDEEPADEEEEETEEEETKKFSSKTTKATTPQTSASTIKATAATTIAGAVTTTAAPAAAVTTTKAAAAAVTTVAAAGAVTTAANAAAATTTAAAAVTTAAPAAAAETTAVTLPGGVTLPAGLPAGMTLPAGGLPAGFTMPAGGIPAGLTMPPGGLPGGFTMPAGMGGMFG